MNTSPANLAPVNRETKCRLAAHGPDGGHNQLVACLPEAKIDVLCPGSEIPNYRSVPIGRQINCRYNLVMQTVAFRTEHAAQKFKRSRLMPFYCENDLPDVRRNAVAFWISIVNETICACSPWLPGVAAPSDQRSEELRNHSNNAPGSGQFYLGISFQLAAILRDTMASVSLRAGIARHRCEPNVPGQPGSSRAA
jgi:hypothetical protein